MAELWDDLSRNPLHLHREPRYVRTLPKVNRDGIKQFSEGVESVAPNKDTTYPENIELNEGYVELEATTRNTVLWTVFACIMAIAIFETGKELTKTLFQWM